MPQSIDVDGKTYFSSDKDGMMRAVQTYRASARAMYNLSDKDASYRFRLFQSYERELRYMQEILDWAKDLGYDTRCW